MSKRCWREIPRRAAISVLVLPVAGITSSRSNSPGCVGHRFGLRLAAYSATVRLLNGIVRNQHISKGDDFAMAVTLADIETARRQLAGAILRTPMLPAPKLSALTGAEVYVKYENLQVTNSFKDRGALNKLASLSADARERGVIAMSAGNHAQAVAYHAARLGIPATIVMPVTTPFVKVQATEAHGAEIVLDGETVAEAQVRAETLARERGLTFVHPYDDPLVIAGQGTIALEMLEDAPELDLIVIPVGGGGLISGVAIAAKAVK